MICSKTKGQINMKVIRLNMKYTTVLSIMVISLLGYSGLMAQTDPYQEEITVVAPYEPTISDALKIGLPAKTGDTLPEKKSFDYEIRSTVLPTPFELAKLRPARLVGEPLDKLYKNYLRAGFGTYTTPMLEYSYNSLRSKEMNYGVKVKHISSSGDIEDYGFPGTSHNQLGFYLNRIGRKGNTVALDIGYQRDVFHFYGFRPEEYTESISRDDIKQRYSDIRAGFNWYSHESDLDKFRHNIRLDISHLSDKFDSRELEAAFNVGFAQNLDVFDFSDLQELSLKIGTDYYHNTRLDSSLGGSAIITLEPLFHTNINEFEIKAGARAQVSTDSTTSLSVSPLAEIKIHVLESTLHIFFGTEGNLSRNSYHRYRNENPYLSDSLPMTFRHEKYRFYGGVGGRLGQRVSFNASIYASSINNMPLFVKDTSYSPSNRFTAVLDDASIFGVKGSFTFQYSEKWKARASAEFRQFSLDENSAWHIPEIMGSVAITYNIRDKIILNTELIMEGERKARSFDDNGEEVAKTLKGFADINLGIEYRYSKILSAFINLNNIASMNYERWQDYPTQGFRLMGGLTYTF